jgi:hypothetical protein
VSFSGKNHGKPAPLVSCFPFSFYNGSMDLDGITSFKAPQLQSRHAVEGVSYHDPDVEAVLKFARLKPFVPLPQVEDPQTLGRRLGLWQRGFEAPS